MPLPDYEDLPSTDKPDDASPATNDAGDDEENASSNEHPSEVAMRISLLGKLIIPPVSP